MHGRKNIKKTSKYFKCWVISCETNCCPYLASMSADAKCWMARNILAGRRFPYYTASISVTAKNENKLFSSNVPCSRDMMGQVCTLRWFSETETCINLKPFLLFFRLIPFRATVFLQIIQFARFHVHHQSAASSDANTWRCSIMDCSCGFILQSSCLRYISFPLHWSVYSFAPEIFWSSVYYNILNHHIIICCCCGAAGRNKSAESFNSVKMASKKYKDHCRHKDCFGENLCIRNFCSVPSSLVCGSPEDVYND